MIGLVLVAGGYGVRRYRGAHPGLGHAAHSVGYHCPMHSSFKSDKPGSCPICSMSLVQDDPESENPGSEASVVNQTGKKMCLLHNCKMAHCKMELTIEPGQKASCPICGVAEAAEISTTTILFYRNPMKPEVTSPTPMKDDMGMDYVPVYAEAGAASTVSGQGNIVLSEERRQMIGMKSEPVKRRDLAVVVRASGRVAYDPDLYHAITEYREAANARDGVKDSPWPDVHERADALVRASELRLRQMGLAEKQISNIVKSSETPTNLLFGGSGGTVWVYAQIYEYEIGLVKPGQRVEMTTPAYPGRKFHGVVKAIDPILSAETRSLKARIEVPNPDDALKLEMYVDAAIRADMGRKLALPTDALVDTGTRKLVFIDLGNGRIEPREVQLGRETDGYYEVLSGLREGEKAVTSANFLIDSESKLRAVTPKAQEKPQQEHKH